jgi:hypothetical protein
MFLPNVSNTANLYTVRTPKSRINIAVIRCENLKLATGKSYLPTSYLPQAARQSQVNHLPRETQPLKSPISIINSNTVPHDIEPNLL